MQAHSRWLHAIRKRVITEEKKRGVKNSVGPCVIPCAFFGKSVKHIFSFSKMYPD